MEHCNPLILNGGSVWELNPPCPDCVGATLDLKSRRDTRTPSTPTLDKIILYLQVTKQILKDEIDKIILIFLIL